MRKIYKAVMDKNTFKRMIRRICEGVPDIHHKNARFGDICAADFSNYEDFWEREKTWCEIVYIEDYNPYLTLLKSIWTGIDHVAIYRREHEKRVTFLEHYGFEFAYER